MKNMILIFTLLFTGLVSAQKTDGFRISLPVEHIYAPRGFDSNDNTQVVIEGFLPNLCYKSPMSKVEVRGHQIFVDLTALRNSESLACAEVVVPFIEVINLGTLSRGSYEIIVNADSFWKKESTIFISDTIVTTVDTGTYANVEYVEKEQGTWNITLKGYNVSSCYQLDEILFTDNGTDTYSILPKMKKVSDDCSAELVPFSYEAEVPQTLRREKVLLHVRTLGGRSVNSLFYRP